LCDAGSAIALVVPTSTDAPVAPTSANAINTADIDDLRILCRGCALTVLTTLLFDVRRPYATADDCPSQHVILACPLEGGKEALVTLSRPRGYAREVKSSVTAAKDIDSAPRAQITVFSGVTMS
jgi:hypothetical protein